DGSYLQPPQLDQRSIGRPQRGHVRTERSGEVTVVESEEIPRRLFLPRKTYVGDRAVRKDPSWRIVETRRRRAPCAIMDCPVHLDGLQGRKFAGPGAANPQETDNPVRPIPSFHADSRYLESAEPRSPMR